MDHTHEHPATASAATAAPQDFQWSSEPEPHAARRKAMLAKYPQIKELYGPCARTKYVCTALVVAQIALAYTVRDAPWWLLCLVAYGAGVMNQSLLLAIHELSHNLAFKTPLYNRLFALFVNLPIGVPVAASFRHYHLLHHTQQGVDGVDTDVPTRAEARLLRGPFSKFLWVLFQGLFYALRPLVMLPKKPDRWEIVNFVAQVAFDVLIFQLWGLKALLYFPISTLIVMGLHPISGHYISEHYVFKGNQETYSYYGPMNLLAFNVGYHNEHHDFPYIAGSHLPALRRLAPEFYDGLVSHGSWTRVIWDYIWRSDVGGFSRVKRRA